MKTLICLLAICALATVASANLLTNPGFESGLDGWQVAGAAQSHVIVTDPAIDTQSLFLGSTFGVGTAAQVVDGSALAAGETVTASFFLHSNRESGGGEFRFRLYEDNDGVIGGDLKGDGNAVFQNTIFDNTGGVFQEFSQDFVSTGANYYVLWLFGYPQSAATEYYVDNASVTPEPASLSLLGLGALALIRRRR